jgi:hypothetical protein
VVAEDLRDDFKDAGLPLYQPTFLTVMSLLNCYVVCDCSDPDLAPVYCYWPEEAWRMKEPVLPRFADLLRWWLQAHRGRRLRTRRSRWAQAPRPNQSRRPRALGQRLHVVRYRRNSSLRPVPPCLNLTSATGADLSIVGDWNGSGRGTHSDRDSMKAPLWPASRAVDEHQPEAQSADAVSADVRFMRRGAVASGCLHTRSIRTSYRV